MTDTSAASNPRKLRRNKLGCGIVIAPLLLMAGYAGILSKDWHPSDIEFPEQGIDVSHHQGKIDWPKLSDQGVDFAYIKATEGGDWIDPRFAENWQAAGDAGIARGAYHFFTLCRPGAEQAANFVANVPLAPAAMPPVVDLEYLGNCSQSPSITDFAVELRAYLDVVEEYYDQQAVLYLTMEFDEEFQVSEQFDRPLWLRSLVIQPDFGARPWTIWQASNFRRLEGIEGRVDWNARRRVAD